MLISAFVFATRIVQSHYFLNPKFQASYLAIFCGSTAWFVSYLAGNPEDRFSHNEAHFTTRSAVIRNVLRNTVDKAVLYFFICYCRIAQSSPDRGPALSPEVGGSSVVRPGSMCHHGGGGLWSYKPASTYGKEIQKWQSVNEEMHLLIDSGTVQLRVDRRARTGIKLERRDTTEVENFAEIIVLRVARKTFMNNELIERMR